MSGLGIAKILLYMAALSALAKPLGWYMARIYMAEPAGLNRWLVPLERWLYRLGGIDPAAEMRWTEYAASLLAFNALGILTVFALQLAQADLPLNPQALPNVSLDSAFNTAVSFATNTNWQGYSGETTMSYLTQTLGLTAQNFLSAATGMATLVALIRGFARRNAPTVGNFWADMTRSVLYILLPLSAALAAILVWQGVPQTLEPYRAVRLTEAVVYEPLQTADDGPATQDAAGRSPREESTAKEQILALGPAASQIAVKQLGTNGGGFFNANSAHPFENPTPLSNFLEMSAILLLPASLCYTFGMMVGDTRQGWAILAAMSVVFLASASIEAVLEQGGNPAFAALGVDQTASDLQAGGNMEGKETRFGIVDSAIWAVATTAASSGSVNAMLDSFTPLGGMIPMWLMQLGEVIYGGVGSGLYGMIVFALVAVFVAGLTIGRTPEYLGKKIEIYEMQMAALVILIPPLTALLGTSVAVLTEAGKVAVANPGAHGFAEILYAFSSAGNNNGSAFAGLSANTPFYNLSLGLAMLASRYGPIVSVLAIAGALAAKKTVPPGPGTLPTHTPLFVGLLVATVLLVGALAFFPALALGPAVEHLQSFAAR